MSSEKETKATVELTRRAFLKVAGVGGVLFPTVIGMVPAPFSGPLAWKAYAQSENKIPDELLTLARKYGEPKG